MTRPFFVTAALLGIASVFGAPLFATGCTSTGVGDPCTPEQEYEPTFNGFDEAEVNVESKSFQCQTRVCLANHFRGRVSCQYGQDSTGAAPTGAKNACAVPGSTADKDPIIGDSHDTKKLKTVPAQCTDRTADKAVYCSCRCADINGQTGDGAQYCKCPDGFSCTQLVTSIGQGDTGLTGAYCIKDKTEYDRNNACSITCDPSVPSAKCGGPQL